MKSTNNLGLVIGLVILAVICLIFLPLNEFPIIIIPSALPLFFLFYSGLKVPFNLKKVENIILSLIISAFIVFLSYTLSNFIAIPLKTIFIVSALFTLVIVLILCTKISNNKCYGCVICESCGGYYQLRKGESIDDLEFCQCGGDLTKNKLSYGYIVCRRCGRYHKIQEGESPSDFEYCHCNGKLRYVDNFINLAKISRKSAKAKKTGDKKLTEPLPSDIHSIWLIVVLCVIFILTPILNDTVFTVILGYLLMLFTLGYGLIAVLFPKKDNLDGIERIALSFGSSIVITALIGSILKYISFETQLVPVLAIFTASMSIIAYKRRFELPDKERLDPEFEIHYKNMLSLFKGESGASKALSLILIASIILAISTTIFIIVTPHEGEKFTEFYILGPNGKASDYPTNLTVDETGNVTIGIVNHEYTNVNYEMVVKLNNITIKQENVTLSNNETYEKPFTFTVSRSGKNQELEFLLYKLPDDTNAYRSLHLWIDVK